MKITNSIDIMFSFCSNERMEELAFKIVKLVGSHDEVVARVKQLPDLQSRFREGAVRLAD